MTEEEQRREQAYRDYYASLDHSLPVGKINKLLQEFTQTQTYVSRCPCGLGYSHYHKNPGEGE